VILTLLDEDDMEYKDGDRVRRVVLLDGVLTDADTGDTVQIKLPELRDYQLRAVVEARAAIAPECKKIIIVSPTGSGKSWIISEIIRLAVEKGSTVLWLVHRRNLVFQMRDTLEQFGITPGVIMAGEQSDTLLKVQIGTYQTYQRRIQFEDGRFFIDASLLIIDECHRSLSKGFTDIIDKYPGKVIIGCTATPTRADNRPMGKVYDKIVDVISVQELTDNGHLAKARYFCSPIDLGSFIFFLMTNQSFIGNSTNNTINKIRFLNSSSVFPPSIMFIVIIHLSICRRFSAAKWAWQ